MTFEDFQALQTRDSQDMIESLLHLGLDSVEVALRVKNPIIASQIKYLQRSSKKLPSYYAARCIISEQAFEQCSSEATATAKFESLQGLLALDLTCGLGIDSLALSRQFSKVIAIETDPLRASMARYNFEKLGATNIEIQNTSAQEFISRHAELKIDLIYIDPSRKTTSSKRVFSLQDSSPNILQIIDQLKVICSQIIIKLSPMFDIEECFRIFGSRISAEVISLNGECKEMLVKIGQNNQGNITNTILKGNNIEHYTFSKEAYKKRVSSIDFTPQYLYVPDVSFIKSRTLNNYLNDYYESYKINSEGYILSETELPNFAGQGFKIANIESYQPKKIKKILKEQNITRANISHLEFPYQTSKILSDLNIKEGGNDRLFFSTYKGKTTIFFVTLHKITKSNE